ncbi:vWA domain-containing protein [Lacipirellula limnantheis]|uniref:von Willebrand factor n=1 Tax=Lacipirellula limnantheis TaxID=2528024 RepID=A0A517TUI0_9BACT|nr:VWA domain-containing protein [Lacipirellula limnantheis]QDT72018.1 von Willebrand factor [Lacipirellula limnantheis]
MNQHDHQPPDRDELRDRLIDAALRERLGGETPPDLSEAILTRASTDPAIRPSTSEATMATPLMPRKQRVSWRFYAVAATLLIATGVFAIPALTVNGLRTARRTTDVPLDYEAASAPRPSGNEVLNSPPNDSTKLLTAQRERSESLMMEVTPRIIIQEEEEHRLGVDVPGELAASPLAASEEKGTTNTFLATRSLHDQASEPQLQDGITATATAPAGPAPTQQNFAPIQPYPETSPSTYSTFSTDAPPYAAAAATGVPAVSPASAPTGASAGGHSLGSTWVALPWQHNDAPPHNQPMEGGLTTPYRNSYFSGDGKASVNAYGKEVGLQGLINDAYSTETSAWHNQATNRDQYARINDNPFLPVTAANTDHRLSTFSIDVDTASYANVRQFLTQSHQLPPPDAVRIEELVNYFDYDYTPPTGDVPFAANVEVAGCPWAPEHRLVRVGIKGREIERTQRPLSNLVFLIDVSGSMNEPNKLPLLVEGMKQLTRELGENDRVAIVVYASSEGLALESTLGTDQSRILAALDQLRAGGSTAGGAGIQLAYQVAQKNFIKVAVNRVILCTDGDFNVGVTSPAELERLAETNAKETGVFLTVLGFGRGNLNDAMMEQVADKGNGNYHYIDTQREAKKVLVEEMTGTLVTIAKDVKIQVEFNPEKVAGYRLIGYENRVLAAEDFNDDKKDAGEIGAGHTVTALYEIVPVGEPVASAAVDELKYAPQAVTTEEKVAEQKENDEPAADDKDQPASDELLTLKIRYKAPDGDVSSKLEFPINDAGQTFAQATDDFKFASAVASFGMLLRNSEHKGNATYAAAAEIAEAASKSHDPHGYRRELVEIVKRAANLSGE